jgi:hypothetical protein
MRLGHALGALLGGLLISTIWAAPAAAGCVDPSALLHPLRLLPMADHSDDGPSIVGLWQFTFLSDGNNVPPFNIPDGAPLDQGYAQWHSDGTEIMNSGRDPVTSNFCLGVWTATGRQTARLNHFALSWDNTGMLCKPEPGKTNCFVGAANIREEVIVDRRGDSYSGFVTIDQYDNDGNRMFRLTGKIKARRVNP